MGFYRFRRGIVPDGNGAEKWAFLDQMLPPQDIRGRGVLDYMPWNLRPLENTEQILHSASFSPGGIPLQVGSITPKPLIGNPNPPWGTPEHWISPEQQAYAFSPTPVAQF